MLKPEGVAPGAIRHVDHGGMLQPFFSHTGEERRLSDGAEGDCYEQMLVREPVRR